ncbi:MAG: N-6 DNA methylase [Bacteroidales bacterium]|nr:N-6 DNA methylase [Bacteroidales bacterium]
MSLFQQSVLNKYLSDLDSEVVNTAYDIFSEKFRDASFRENILKTSEISYYERFLDFLFDKVLGYKIAPDNNHNIILQLKTEIDSKKPDGVILSSVNDINSVIAVIEVKDSRTSNLRDVELQAFNYKNSYKGCKYIITSNFQKLRFYINNRVEYEEFDLFNLSKEKFYLFYFCLAKETLLKDLPAVVKTASAYQEIEITKKLYLDYSNFKKVLFQNITEKNSLFTDKLLLFKKTQKLLDRILFILFAEDKLLIPANHINTIIKEWKLAKNLGYNESLYERFKKHFNYLYKGWSNDNYKIFPYNGGLFEPDDILDKIIIDDNVLSENTQKLSLYNFDTEIDVNILGHIFEHSLNEIEEIQAELQGINIDKSKSKRKKEGVFYTPKYITKYIVDNSLGLICSNKKTELGISDLLSLDFPFSDNNKKKELLSKIDSYRDWLLQLKICDPACGSGAFLNEALDFLINEHKMLDEYIMSITGASLQLSDIENSILENNIFGVDINEEAVEIAKLSLWLKTARRGRKLLDLSNNIKCGNSLIDDPLIAGTKAFNWFVEFPQVFPHYRKPSVEEPEPIYEKMTVDFPGGVKEPLYSYKPQSKGFVRYGFDLIIGNPPYGTVLNTGEKNFLASNDPLVPDFEIYIYFISLYKKILKEKGLLSFIFPNTFLSNLFGKKYRDELFNKTQVYLLTDLSEDITFSEASVRTCILSLKKTDDDYQTLLFKIAGGEFIKAGYSEKNTILNKTDNLLSLFHINAETEKIITKIKIHKALKEYFSVSQGLIPYDKYRGHDEYTIKNRIWHSSVKKDDTYKKELKGADINRYYLEWNKMLWVSYGEWLAAPREQKFFISPRVLIREITDKKLFCTFTADEFYNTPSIINIIDEKGILDLKYALVILNSKLMGWLHNTISPKANKGIFPKILINDVRNLPVPLISKKYQQDFIQKADFMLSLNLELNKLSNNFLDYVSEQLNLERRPEKLNKWFEISFDNFNKIINKELKAVKRPVLTKKEEFRWKTEIFDDIKMKAQNIKTQIDKTDKEIDFMVYKLYDLSDEEINLIENK